MVKWLNGFSVSVFHCFIVSLFETGSECREAQSGSISKSHSPKVPKSQSLMSHISYLPIGFSIFHIPYSIKKALPQGKACKTVVELEGVASLIPPYQSCKSKFHFFEMVN
jgi:hypothetical protein